ncbi:MAG TPA: YciI family protein [Candidatus Saccharimonadales bacterium]|nr:YciI family protein [Candidatus Saccharimonadales bacterium]
MLASLLVLAACWQPNRCIRAIPQRRCIRNRRALLYDGPFAETKELLAGFYLVDAKDLNEALKIAAEIAPAKHGSIEVRPVRDLDVPGYRSPDGTVSFPPAAP